MNVGPRSGRPLGSLLLRTLARPRPYSTEPAAAAAAAAAATPAGAPPAADLPPAIPAAADSSSSRSELGHAAAHAPAVAAAVVLARAPVLTPAPTPFEQSFYFYQARLNARLALPFTRYFYFKKNTPADLEWKRKRAALAAQGELYTGHGPRAWADELLVGDARHAPPDLGYAALVASSVTGEDVAAADDGARKGALEPPRGRTTDADQKKDRTRLDRALDRTLYLLVRRRAAARGGKKEPAPWTFPESLLDGRENLKERTLAEAAGVNMNTWFVGNAPIGHYSRAGAGTGAEHAAATKVFFHKARIMAGQADLAANTLGLDAFAWLTKDEIREVAGKPYYDCVKAMLPDR